MLGCKGLRKLASNFSFNHGCDIKRVGSDYGELISDGALFD